MGTATGNDSHTSEGNDINDLGEMVGASTMQDGQYRAVYKRATSGKNEGYYDLGFLGTGQDAGNQSVALAISAQGLIVGQSKVKIGCLGVASTRVTTISASWAQALRMTETAV